MSEYKAALDAFNDFTNGFDSQMSINACLMQAETIRKALLTMQSIEEGKSVVVPVRKLEIQARHYRDTAKLIEGRGYRMIDATDQMHAWLMAAHKTETLISDGAARPTTTQEG